MIPRPGWYIRGQWYEFNRMRQGVPFTTLSIPTGVVLTSKLVVFDTITIPKVAVNPTSVSGALVRMQVGIWAMDPLVGHAIGAPLAQTGPFTPTVSPFLQASLLAPVTLGPGAYVRGVAVSAAAGNFGGVSTPSESSDDQGNSVAGGTTRGWSTPWTYSAVGLPTFTAGLTWTFQQVMPAIWGLVT